MDHLASLFQPRYFYTLFRNADKFIENEDLSSVEIASIHWLQHATRAWRDLLIHRETRRRIEGIMKKTRHNETGNSGCPRKGRRSTMNSAIRTCRDRREISTFYRENESPAPCSKYQILASANFCLESINYE